MSVLHKTLRIINTGLFSEKNSIIARKKVSNKINNFTQKYALLKAIVLNYTLFSFNSFVAQ